MKHLLFAAASFAGAFLLFALQPMTGKAVLPLLGGSPAVWNACLFFFQAALLAGYLYAHGGLRLLGPERLVPVHLALVVAAALALPAAVPGDWTPRGGGSPVADVLGLLTRSIGVPFVLLATTAPLVQRWYHAADDGESGGEPYFLYAASNLGSLGALLAYPFLVEPLLDLGRQTTAWSGGFAVWTVLVAGCAAWGLRGARAGAGESDRGARAAAGAVAADAAAAPAEGRASGGRGAFSAPSDPEGRAAARVRWVLLAFAPSSLLLGVTTHLTTDVAAAPLLWVVPLALYLLSFVVAFSRRPVISHRRALRWQPLLVIPLVVAWFWGVTIPTATQLLLHLAAFFVIALVCHGELVRLRPPARDLSDFYLWIAVGGALGGLFNAVVAPAVFPGAVEYPLVLVLSLLLRPARERRAEATDRAGGGRRIRGAVGRLARDLAPALAVGAAGLAVLWIQSRFVSGGTGGRLVIFLIVGGIAVACLLMVGRPLRLAVAMGALLLAGWADRHATASVLLAERSFFGIHRVALSDDGRHTVLHHGTTIHGAQSRDPDERLEPRTYYRVGGPLDQLLHALPDAGAGRDVGVLGLGTGSMSCLGTGEERWTYFEIDPAVVRIATDPDLFTYLAECSPGADIVRGDARLSLRDGAERFDVLVGDAFSSDAIPVHLLTVEAIRLYLERLEPGGVLVFHVSNRHMDLEPVLAAAARELGLVALAQVEQLGDEAEDDLLFGSHWVVLAREPGPVDGLVADPRWRPAAADPGVSAWTDDHSDVVGVLEWGS